jgi:hypothetical protein
MADDRSAAVKDRAQPGQDTGEAKANQPQIVPLNLSLTKKVAVKIGRVKRWEERSKSKSLELTGRR